ncbi:polymerase delta-interacting protein 3-like isoform X2 [Lutzomyia longipalpis]|nr:polymerase delta-interacting protein 3-like isoform X2 [Lutzomyia longipalpis]
MATPMEVDMSLDEIIKKKKITRNPSKNGLGIKKGGGVMKPKLSTQKKPQIVDARLKIIQKNRSKIRDARDKLSEIARKSDARLKIARKKLPPPPQLGMKMKQGGGGFQKPKNANRRGGFAVPVVDTPYIGAPRGYVDHDRVEDDEITFPIESPVLRRTVSNDRFGGAPNVHKSGREWSGGDIAGDPFDIYDIPRRRLPEEPPRAVYPSTRQMYPGPSESLSPRKGILRRGGLDSPPRILERRYIPDENSQLSYEMRTRLERAPDPRASAGMFSRREPTPSPPPASDGYRIVVSNLHPSVTQNDIVELFEDIGQLMEARLLRPGVAEVIFKSLKDAEQAVDTYHNRQLDGLPMKCLLVSPKVASSIKRTTSLSR